MARVSFYCLSCLIFALSSLLILNVESSPSSSLPRESKSYFTASPFYRNEEEIINRIESLIVADQNNNALDYMKQVISIERQWRHRLCLNLFGETSCNGYGNLAEPFFMWKRKLIYDLEVDPTQEIINQIRQHINY